MKAARLHAFHQQPTVDEVPEPVIGVPPDAIVKIGSAAGWLGHTDVQCQAPLTATTIIVVDRNPDALKLAEQLGAHHTVVADGSQVPAVLDLTGGAGAEVVLDFVAEQGAENDAWAM